MHTMRNKNMVKEWHSRYCVHGKNHIRLKGSKLHNVIVEKPCLQATFEYIDGRGSPDIKRQFVPNERCCVCKSAISVEHGVGVLVARRIE